MQSSQSLVVGASGQIGAQIVRLLGPAASLRTSRQEGPEVDGVLDLATLETPGQIPASLKDAALREIFCVGGMSHVDACESESAAAYHANCRGPEVLAAEAARRDIPFVYYSTEYVFDGTNGPYSEDASMNPLSVYGKSKAAGEAAVLSVCPHALIVRTTVVFGPDPHARNFLYALIANLRAGRRMRVPVDQISTPSYNVDVAAATIALVRAGASGVFHICGPDRLSRFDFACECARLLGLPCELIDGVPTAALGQAAPRPLSAGLISEKLAACAGYRMRGVRAALEDWLGPSFALDSFGGGTR